MDLETPRLCVLILVWGVRCGRLREGALELSLRAGMAPERFNKSTRAHVSVCGERCDAERRGFPYGCTI